MKALPSPKRAGPKGLRAESARAFTGRRNSHSGRGGDFLSRQPNFFTETAVTPERKFGQKLAFLVNFGQAMQAYSVLLVGRLVVVARGLYPAGHLFTLYFYIHLHFLVLPCIFLFSAEHIEK